MNYHEFRETCARIGTNGLVVQVRGYALQDMSPMNQMRAEMYQPMIIRYLQRVGRHCTMQDLYHNLPIEDLAMYIAVDSLRLRKRIVCVSPYVVNFHDEVDIILVREPVDWLPFAKITLPSTAAVRVRDMVKKELENYRKEMFGVA